jgi:outer membrane cobalamin receptor
MLCTVKVYGQVDTTIENFYKPNIEELSNIERADRSEASVSVAGFTTTTLRESPGIVTLITSEDILKMGARDLSDVLRLVPGFDLSTDILPVLTMRGNGVNEGKVLLLLDGHAMNNISSGYAFFFQRFPLSSIERIEIIRGAGSAIYGGLAGLAVINIHTKKASSHKQETQATGFTSATQKGIFQSRIEGYSLNKLKGGIDLNMAASYNQAQFSDSDFISPIYNFLIESSKYAIIESSSFNAGLRYKRLDVRFFQNNMQSTHPEFDNTKLHTNYSALALRYLFNIGEKISIHTRLSWNNQTAYFTDIPRVPPILGAGLGEIKSLEKLNLADLRLLANVYAVYQPIENITISAGAETHRDRARYINEVTFLGNRRQASYTNIGVFAEANIKSKIINITAGVRADQYADIAPVAVPRIALTKAFKHVHFKALYTEAFKTPTLGNIENKESTRDIVAERFRLVEFEVGAKPFKNLQLSLNVYDIFIQNFILRTEQGIGADFFFGNSGSTGTQGIEGEARFKNDKLSLQLGYSFYRLAPNAESVLYRLPTINPGTPAQKATLIADYELHHRVHLNLTFMHLTNKFLGSGFTPKEVREFANEQHLNLNVQYHDFLIKNLTFSVGGYNLLNQSHRLISWKKDLLSEVTTTLQGREIGIRLTYQVRN